MSGDVRADEQTVADRLTAGESDFCHIVCDIHEAQTLCGFTTTANWCPNDPCDNRCVVCIDIAASRSKRCRVCGKRCWSTWRRVWRELRQP